MRNRVAGMGFLIVMLALTSSAQTSRSATATSRDASVGASAVVTTPTATATPSATASRVAASSAASATPPRIEVRHADRVDYDGATHVIVMTGSVHVVRGTMSMKADRVDITLAEDEKSVRTAVASGHVEVVDGTRRAIGERAVYTESSTELDLTGSPKLWDGGNEIEADKIVYNLNSHTMRAEGRVHGLFLPGGFAPAAGR